MSVQITTETNPQVALARQDFPEDTDWSRQRGFSAWDSYVADVPTVGRRLCLR